MPAVNRQASPQRIVIGTSSDYDTPSNSIGLLRGAPIQHSRVTDHDTAY
ncbi:hypothetical protein [Actinomyces gerencseriae]